MAQVIFSDIYLSNNNSILSRIVTQAQQHIGEESKAIDEVIIQCQ